MYLDHFSLKKFPFRITPDPSMFFPGGAQGPGVVLNALVYAITSGEGIVKVVGEVGSGKTMLCRMLEERLPENIKIVYIANPALSPRDIVYAIAFELGLDADSGTDRLMLMQQLQDYLLGKHGEGGQVVVFIEEAQGMPVETLEEIRLLSNLETHHNKLMQIVLFGQPELDKNLQDKSIRQLRERITHSFYLQPMSLEATRDYLKFRMQSAGCPWPEVFTPRAVKLLAKASAGLTRRVNILADKSLMAAFAESSVRPEEQFGAIQRKVLPVHVRAAVRDSNYTNRALFPWPLVGAGVAVLVLLGAVFVWREALPLLAPSTEQSAVAEPSPTAGSSSPSRTAAEPAAVVAQEAPAEREPPAENAVQGPPLPATTSDDTGDVSVAGSGAVDGGADDAGTLVRVQSPDASRRRVDFSIPAVAARVEPPQTREPSPAGDGDAGESGDSGDIVQRLAGATGDWLDRIAGAGGYTIQLASFSVGNDAGIRGFLQSLTGTGLLQETYLCEISATASLQAQWIVFHGEFGGVSLARSRIEELPAAVREHDPFIRNTGNVACLND